MRRKPSPISEDGGSVDTFVLRLLRVCVVAALALGCLTVLAEASQGAARLDQSFGSDGVAFAAGSPTNQISPARKVVLDSKGRLVVLGNDRDGIMVLGRFKGSGVPDGSFGSGGDGLVYATDFDRKNPVGGGGDLAIDTNGDVLTTGALGWPVIYPWNKIQCGYVSRVSSRGFLNHRFADDGRTPVCLDKAPHKVGLKSSAISLGKDGSVIIAGQAWHSKYRSGAFVARLKRGGSRLDQSFTGNKRTRTAKAGIVEVLPPKFQHGWFSDVKSLARGKILAAGTLQGRYMVARFLQNGKLDRSFGKKGIASFDLDGREGCICSAATGMAIDDRGRIILSGHAVRGSRGDANLRLKVIRLKPNGRLDRSFGKNGVATPTFPEFLELDDGTKVQQFLTQGVAVQKNGKVVVAGRLNLKYTLVRLKQNGTQDPAFFENGLYTDWVFGVFGSAWDVIIDRKGRIVSSGGTYEGGFLLVRMLPGD